ncbi:hypothetical protein BAE44_0015924 [Dichanthelium oligosanthes]|uniref:F-box domain-containing protein n=1 Tax=Dichanthelium oligosanthes TaxID=888268 RepID=A0A1E5VD26_9POAL|nr:hypothetical protein BAE44_0015924 [Dichanthelium oligosanthes]
MHAREASVVTVTAWVLRADVLLKIVARSDTRTLVRCAALCKALRRNILSLGFLRCVTGQENPAERIVPPCLLGYLHTHDKQEEDEEVQAALFSIVHPDPATVPAVGSFSDEHLTRFISHSTADLLSGYKQAHHVPRRPRRPPPPQHQPAQEI